MPKMLKIKSNRKLNLGHLEGMPEHELAYLSPGNIMELPDCYIVNFYLKSGDFELVEEETETVIDEPQEEAVIIDIPPPPKKKKKKKKGE